MIRREIERFVATDDDGNIYHVVIYGEFIRDNTLRGGGEIAGGKRAELDDGRTLTPSGDDFRIVQTGQIIRRLV